MKIFFRLSGLAMLAVLALPAQAVDGDAVIGGALGGAAGAAVGSAIGGRDAAIIGGAIGGAAGTAVMTNNRREQVVVRRERDVVYVRDDHHDHGRHLGHYKHKKHKHEHGHDD